MKPTALRRYLSQRGIQIFVYETVGALEQAGHDDAFVWVPNIDHLKELASKNHGVFLFIEAIHPMITDPFQQGHGSRQWTERELLAMARTAIGKGLNINHRYELNPAYVHVVQESEYNEKTKTLEMIVFESDPEIIRLIREQYITKVSIQGGPPRRETEVCTSCGTSGCKCHKIPEGVVLGEDDGQALAYVVTKPGATYYGRPIEAERPGDWNSKIRIAETETETEAETISFNMGGTNHGQMTSEVKADLIRMAESTKQPKLAEALKAPEKFLTSESLQAFNDAMNSGDAIQAIMILAGDVYNSSAVPQGQGGGEADEMGDDRGDEKKDLAVETLKVGGKPLAEVIDARVTEALKGDGVVVAAIVELMKSGKVAEVITAKVNEAVTAAKIPEKVAEAVKADPSLKEVAGLKESFKNLSTQVTETFAEVKAAGMPSKGGGRIRETEGGAGGTERFDLGRARNIANASLP